MNKSYLNISGTIDDNNVFAPRRGFETRQQPTLPLPRNTTENLNCVVNLLCKDQVVLHSIEGIVRRTCGETTNMTFNAFLPLHPLAVAYEIKLQDVTIHKVSFSALPPNAKLLETNVENDELQLIWERSGDAAVTYDVFVELESGIRRIIAKNLNTNHLTTAFEVNDFPGKHRFVLRACDGVRSSDDFSDFLVGPPIEPKIAIALPDVNKCFNVGDLMNFHAYCIDKSVASVRIQELIDIRWMLDGALVHEGSLQNGIHLTQSGEQRLEVRCKYYDRDLFASVLVKVAPPTSSYLEWQKQFMSETVPDFNDVCDPPN
jgi:hypothetical protein